MTAFLLGVAFLAAVFLLIRWYINAEPRDLMRFMPVFAVIGLILAAGVLIFGVRALIAAPAFFLLTGKTGALLRGGLSLFLTALRLRSAAGAAKNFSRAWTGGKAGQSSRVAAKFVDMTLDHDTGALDGTVTEGAHAGAKLSELDTAALTALLARWRAEDAESARLLQAYLDRAREGWRGAAGADGGGNAGAGAGDAGSGAGAGAAPASGAMGREEALAVLGLEPGADEKTVRAAHRRLISKLHPDLGGADYLAAKINQAKDVLLGQG